MYLTQMKYERYLYCNPAFLTLYSVCFSDTIGAVMSKLTLILAIKDNCTMLKVIFILYDDDLEEEKNSRYARQ